MAGDKASSRARGKSGALHEGKKDFPPGNPIAPVMQKLKSSLKGDKPAPTLAFLTGQPLSICQKLLSGHRRPNAAMYEALFAGELIVDAILGLTEGATHPKVRAVRRAVKRIKLQDEIARLEAGDDE